MAFDVCSVWVGATTDTTARVRARLVAATASTLLVADNEAMTGPVSLGPTAPGTDNVITWDVTGLDPDTRYWCLVDDGALNTSFKSTFRTHPGATGERLSYVFGAAGDAGLTGDGDEGTVTSGVSNGVVFDTMKAQSLDEEWAWFSHLGDLHYKNIATNTPASFRSAYFETMNYGAVISSAARQGQFMRSVASTYVWDDHDFGPNDSDRTSASKPAAQQVYREWVPHYTLPDAAGIYQSWQVGRVLYIASDVRSFRDPNSTAISPSKTMLGTAQKAWMETLLSTSTASALVWQSPSRWVGGTDTWANFPYERDEMVQLFGDTGWLDRMVFMTADMHANSICTGPNNPVGRFPMYMFASLDSGAWSTGTEYDIGSVSGRRQYGTMRVQDDGHTIALTGTCYHDGTVQFAHTAYIQADATVIALDYAAGHISPPLEPTDDDQKLRNAVTAKRQDGGEATFVKTEGSLNTSDPETDPDGVGVYDESVTVNVATDDQLPGHAGWRVHLGTVNDPRYPLVHLDLAANPGLADDVTALALGDRMTIANPPSWLPPETIELIAEGGTEYIGLYDWNVELNASPGKPWTVAQLPADVASAGPDGPNRLDTSGSELVTAVDADDTEFIVHTPPDGTTPRIHWVNSTGLTAVLPTHFPFDVRLAGETVRVTACSPVVWDSFTRTTASGWGTASSGQAWTTTGGSASDYSTSGTTGVHSLGTVNVSRHSVTTAPSPDLDMTVDISSSVLAAGASQFTHLIARYLDGNNMYAARLGFTTTATLQLVIQKRVGGTQTDLVTVTAPGKHVAATFYTLRFQLEGTALRAKAWKRGGQEPEGWQATTTDTSLTSAGSLGTRSILGSGNTNPLPVTVTYDNLQLLTPQRMTVTRSVNTVVKAQAAGTALSLAQPSPVAL
ncbi:alkaline phosphatase D family protein [Streptomyces sp. NPDC006208]|uniref:alkaline phosphatase D family protein n=1 Tax=Streptomyces sp. NPDC006208 TaxID=3156734 RepID=UPI0033B002F6